MRDQIVIKSVAPAEEGVYRVTETAGDHILHSISQPSQQKRCQTSISLFGLRCSEKLNKCCQLKIKVAFGLFRFHSIYTL